MCGICGIVGPSEEELLNLVYYLSLALQHRGQESHGFAVSCGKRMKLLKQAGRVERFTDRQYLKLNGGNRSRPIAVIGHVRYSNTGGDIYDNYQPFVVGTKFGPLALAHNGNLVNTIELREEASKLCLTIKGTSDSEIIAVLISYYSYYFETIEETIIEVIKKLRGSFALVMMIGDSIIGIRDPWGIRPLSFGKLNGSSYVFASETCALESIGANWLFDLTPGEMVVASSGTYITLQAVPMICESLCLFELIYFAAPASVMYDRCLQTARRHMGEFLFKEHPIDLGYPGQVVIGGVPNTGIPAGQGYAEAAGLEYRGMFQKNPYVYRTFIQPAQRLREMGVRSKLLVYRREVLKKRVVVVEDSIVRATTALQLVKMLRDAGAAEVHMRISSPPYRHRCQLGIDTQNKDELIAANHSVEEICRHIGADSLGYLSLEGLIDAINKEKYEQPIPSCNFCKGCFTGEYPPCITSQEKILTAL